MPFLVAFSQWFSVANKRVMGDGGMCLRGSWPSQMQDTLPQLTYFYLASFTLIFLLIFKTWKKSFIIISWLTEAFLDLKSHLQCGLISLWAPPWRDIHLGGRVLVMGSDWIRLGGMLSQKAHMGIQFKNKEEIHIRNRKEKTEVGMTGKTDLWWK